MQTLVSIEEIENPNDEPEIGFKIKCNIGVTPETIKQLFLESHPSYIQEYQIKNIEIERVEQFEDYNLYELYIIIGDNFYDDKYDGLTDAQIDEENFYKMNAHLYEDQELDFRGDGPF